MACCRGLGLCARVVWLSVWSCFGWVRVRGGVGGLVVNCIVDASIVCSLCCVVCSVVCAWCACARGVLCVLI